MNVNRGFGINNGIDDLIRHALNNTDCSGLQLKNYQNNNRVLERIGTILDSKGSSDDLVDFLHDTASNLITEQMDIEFEAMIK